MGLVDDYQLAACAPSVDDSPRIWTHPWSEDGLRFKVLGPLEVFRGEHECTPSAPKLLQVLALLVLHANRIVHIETLVRLLWGDRPPRSAVATIQTYIYQLRRFLTREQVDSGDGDLLVTKNPGYLLRVHPDQVDLQQFQRLSRQGQVFLRGRRLDEAASRLRAALGLWSGSPLANVPMGARLDPYVTDLQEQRRNALQLRIEAEIELGLHRELIGELRSLVVLHPLDEWMYGQLIRVLARSGRRSDALHAYHHLRTTLAAELGLDPSPELQQLYQQLLGTD
ncbi:AfsR/SARP family transcriptional regulator [Plantactinospora sp. B6F1]|uniref:AfsR/SARP family transcriptional regulator n=1 Tax=Plantactinospora sp. B6F1 TaxID=3158971 RepID=UPI0032D8BE29